MNSIPLWPIDCNLKKKLPNNSVNQLSEFHDADVSVIRFDCVSSYSSGSSLYEMMVSSVGDHYTGGGTTHFEKEEHFAKERERWKDYEPDSDFH